MEVKKLIEYDMKRVISRASKDFGTIKRGTEDFYNPQLDYFEQAIYKIHEVIPISDSSLKQVIEMIIYDIKGRVENKVYDYSDIRDDELVEFAKQLEMLFDPFLNKEIMVNELGKENLKALFTLPVICLLRIYDSIDFWHNRYGINGYYKMLREMVIFRVCLGKYPYALDEKYLD